MGILIPLVVIAFCGYIIWRAGDSFVEGSNYIGRNLSEGVKGATINAWIHCGRVYASCA